MRGNRRRGTKEREKGGDMMKGDERFLLDECEYCYILQSHHGFMVRGRYGVSDTLL